MSRTGHKDAASCRYFMETADKIIETCSALYTGTATGKFATLGKPDGPFKVYLSTGQAHLAVLKLTASRLWHFHRLGLACVAIQDQYWS